MSIDSGSGEDLSGLASTLTDSYEEFSVDPLDDWTTRSMVATMVPLLVALSVLQMVSGSVLEAYEEVLLTNPSLLILVPVQIGTAGNLGSIMCSRLSTQLHLGTFEFRLDNPDIRANSGAVLALGLTVFVLVGIAAWAIGQALGGTLTLLEVMTISLMSGMLLAVFVVVVSLVSVYTSYRLGYNPDDITIPVVTNVCDITGVLILFAVVGLVL
ncbi:MAG: mgtE-like transporter [Natronomonas sp.]|jgi:mgtE-like transporter|uniref:magnesium transporter n=1 Tax=Natronomonas sp. TaxID=2184060 RepID=UPI0039E23586